MKIYSWNVNGLRSVLNKGALQAMIKSEAPFSGTRWLFWHGNLY